MSARVAVCALLAAWLVACSSAEDRAQAARQETLASLRRGDAAAAREALEKLEQELPDTPEALLERTELMVRVGDAPDARWLLEDGMRRFPERQDLRVAFARVALLLGDSAAALDAVRSVPADSELHPHALVLAGHAQLELGHLEDALALFAEAERLYPELPEARIARISTLVSEERYDEALAEIEKGRSHFAGTELEGRADLLSAQIRAKKGEEDAAFAMLTERVKASPSDLAAWRSLLQVASQAGRIDEALGLLEGAIEAHPDEGGLYSLQGSTLRLLGRTDEAEAALLRFAERTKSPAATLQLADLYAREEEGSKAVTLFQDSLERFPSQLTLRSAYAETLVGLGRLDEARAQLDAFREAAPEDPRVGYLEARIALAEGDADRAVEMLERLVPRFDTGLTQLWLGFALEQLGDRRGAERRYALALARDPDLLAAHKGLLRMAELRGDWKDVRAHAERLIRRFPNDHATYLLYAQALVLRGHPELAEVVGRRYEAAHPDRFEPLLIRARSLAARGRHAEAAALLEDAIARFGSEPELEAQLALSLGASGHMEEALARARAGAERHPEESSLQRTLGALLFQQGEGEAGSAAIDRAIALDPRDPVPLQVRGDYLASRGQLERAASDYRRFLELRPDDARVLAALGTVQDALGRREEAVGTLRRAAEIDDRSVMARNNLAVILEEQGDVEGALEVAQEAYALAPEDPQVADTLAVVYLRKGLADRAVALLERATAAAPQQAEIRRNLARAYEQAGRDEDARRVLAALERD